MSKAKNWRMGEGTFNYFTDWLGQGEDDDAPDGKQPPYKAVISALIADEVARQVEKKLAAVAKAAPQAPATRAPYRVKVERGPDGLIRSLLMEPGAT